MTSSNLLPVTSRHTNLDRTRYRRPRVLTIAAILLFGVACTATSRAEIEIEMVKNPKFKPADFALGAARLDRNITNGPEFWSAIDDWTVDILGESHVLADDSREQHPGNGVLFPKNVDNEFENGLRRAVAAGGGILTDVITASQMRGRNFYSLSYALVPFNDSSFAELSDDDQVIPNDVFPLTYTKRTYHNGVRAEGERTDRPDFESLSSYGMILDEAGESRDFSDSQWKHQIIRGNWGAAPSRSDSQVVGEWESQVEIRDANGNGWNIGRFWEIVPRASRVDGDLSHNGELDMHDLEILTQNVAVDAINLKLDMNDDNSVDVGDVHFWVTDLKKTWIGDANLDGEFNSSDFVRVFEAGKYEKDQLALWSEGDWNADERFDSGDFVAAFANGGYEQGPRAAVAAVPEPSGRLLALYVLAMMPFVRARST